MKNTLLKFCLSLVCLSFFITWVTKWWSCDAICQQEAECESRYDNCMYFCTECKMMQDEWHHINCDSACACDSCPAPTCQTCLQNEAASTNSWSANGWSTNSWSTNSWNNNQTEVECTENSDCNNWICQDWVCVENHYWNAGINISTKCLLNGQCSMNIYETMWIRKSNPNPDVTTFAQDVILWATKFFGTVLTILFIVSWLSYVMAWFSGKAPDKAKKMMIWSIVWLLFITLSYTIIRLIQFIATWWS